MTQVTKHAQKRFKQRCGVHKTDTQKNARRALRDGVAHKGLTGSLKRYMDALYFRHRRANNIRLYNGSVFIFTGEKLITVFPIPDKYKDDPQLQKKEEAE